VIRPPLTFFVAALAIVIGMAGLVRGSLPQSSASGSSAGSSAVGTAAAPIVVGGGYVRESVNGINAAAYFTIYNTTGTADVLTAVSSGAGASTTLHSYDANGAMVGVATGLIIPAHGSVAMAPGKVHVMIEQLYGPLKPGQTVNFELTFGNAGLVVVTAPVIGIRAPAPTATGS
jgi:periplasmic copper chaperone A